MLSFAETVVTFSSGDRCSQVSMPSEIMLLLCLLMQRKVRKSIQKNVKDMILKYLSKQSININILKILRGY